MTKVTIGTDFIEISGHAEEVVACHGISAIGQMVANFVEKNGWGDVERNDAKLCIYNVDEQYCSTPLFIAMTDGLKDIEMEYPGNIIFEYVQK